MSAPNLYGIPICVVYRRRRILMRSRSNLPPIMKSALRPWSPDERVTPFVAGDDRPPGDGAPTPGEVLSEVGLLLAIHLAVAFAVSMTLRLWGIA